MCYRVSNITNTTSTAKNGNQQAFIVARTPPWLRWGHTCLQNDLAKAFFSDEIGTR